MIWVASTMMWFEGELMTVKKIIIELRSQADEGIAQHSTRFFKTGEGEYGEGDKFLGLRVPTVRNIVKQYRKQSTLADAIELLHNEYHEVRLCAILLMVALFELAKNDPDKQTQIVEAYLAHTHRVNNWDLVDSSAHKILGKYLLDKERSILHQLSRSDCLWERRISMMATYTFIKQGQFDDTFRVAETLLSDSHDLIHKIVGWMLREVGNQDKPAEEHFLKQHCKAMPRTMLRYSIEKFSKEQRQQYLAGTV